MKVIHLIVFSYSMDGWMDGFIYSDPSLLGDIQATTTIYFLVFTLGCTTS